MAFPEFDLSADKTSVVSADKTSVVSADKTSVVSADKTSVVSQDIPSSLPTQGRPRSGRPCVANALGMSWERNDRWLDYTLFECGRPGIGSQNVSVCLCEALAAPEAKKGKAIRDNNSH